MKNIIINVYKPIATAITFEINHQQKSEIKGSSSSSSSSSHCFPSLVSFRYISFYIFGHSYSHYHRHVMYEQKVKKTFKSCPGDKSIHSSRLDSPFHSFLAHPIRSQHLSPWWWWWMSPHKRIIIIIVIYVLVRILRSGVIFCF